MPSLFTPVTIASNTLPMRCASRIGGGGLARRRARRDSPRSRARCTASRSPRARRRCTARARRRSPPSRAAASRDRRSGGSARSRASSRARRGRSGPGRRLGPGLSSTYSPGPSSFTMLSERSGKRSGSAARRAPRNVGERTAGPARAGSVVPYSLAMLDDAIPPLRLAHDAPDRRPVPARRGYCAMATFAAIMKSSIRSRARFFRVTASDSTLPSFATGVASIVSNSSAPACSRTA